MTPDDRWRLFGALVCCLVLALMAVVVGAAR